ncbi:MAG: hypothetical protein P8I97_00815, partial [Verrucomicrobiales bacterium]|nr:hypothetical protein [Verrucomicrobiales bacterium]
SRAARKSLSKYKGEICFTNSRANCGFCKDTHKPAGYMTSHDRVIRWSEYKKEDEWYKKIFSSS